MERTETFRLQAWFITILTLGHACLVILPGWMILERIQAVDIVSGRWWFSLVSLGLGMMVFARTAQTPILITTSARSISYRTFIGGAEIPWVDISELTRSGSMDRIISIRWGRRQVEILTSLFVDGEPLRDRLLENLREPDLEFPLRWRPLMTPSGRFAFALLPVAGMACAGLVASGEALLVGFAVALALAALWIFITGLAQIELTPTSISRRIFPGITQTIRWEHVYEVSTAEDGEEGSIDIQNLVIAGKGGKITLRSRNTPHYPQVRDFILTQVDHSVRAGYRRPRGNG